MCSHGHKFQFGDVQQAFTTGDPITREQPKMPPDGVQGESREVWVQLLKIVNGPADGPREWRNCFLATERGLGFETSRLGTVCFGAEGRTTKRPWYHWSGRRRHCWWRRQILRTSNLKAEETFHFRALGKWEREKFCSREVVQAADGIHARWKACLHQESGLCAPRKNEEGTIGRCKRDWNSSHEISARSCWVFSA